MTENNNDYLRPGTVKKKMDSVKLSDLETKIFNYKSSEAEEILRAIINDYKSNYEYLPSAIDNEILNLIKMQNTATQAELLLDVTSIRISVETLNTYFVYWVDNNELRNNPIFEDSLLKQRLKNMFVHLPIALNYVRFPTIPLQPFRSYFDSLIQLYVKIPDIWPMHFRLLYQRSIFLKPKIHSNTKIITETELEVFEESETEQTYSVQEFTDTDIWNKLEEKLEDMDYKLDKILHLGHRILLAIQTGFLSNEKTDEKLFHELEKDESYLQPLRVEIIEILAERSLLRAVAGIEQNKKFAKALWYIVQGIDILVSLISGLKTLAPGFYTEIFGV